MAFAQAAAMRFATILLSLLGAVLVTACGAGGGTYCQSGPKYGTQCYPGDYARNPPGSGPVRPGDDPRR